MFSSVLIMFISSGVYSAVQQQSVLLPSVARDVVLHLPLALLVFVRLAVEKSLQHTDLETGWL